MQEDSQQQDDYRQQTGDTQQAENKEQSVITVKVVETIGKLKNGQDGKAPGICGISAEVIKAGDSVVVKWLHKMSAEVPED